MMEKSGFCNGMARFVQAAGQGGGSYRRHSATFVGFRSRKIKTIVRWRQKDCKLSQRVATDRKEDFLSAEPVVSGGFSRILPCCKIFSRIMNKKYPFFFTSPFQRSFFFVFLAPMVW
ncbi:MAG: hypothetical protein RDA78_04650 [Roseibium sp.]|uniref:hypothetical protein n=1 Tax=Roseibium sp. TaxID=1936156 RepID=UPI003D9C63AB